MRFDFGCAVMVGVDLGLAAAVGTILGGAGGAAVVAAVGIEQYPREMSTEEEYVCCTAVAVLRDGESGQDDLLAGTSTADVGNVGGDE